MSDNTFHLSCVVPVFNEAANLPRFIPALAATLAELTPDFDIVIVDDGSTDQTLEAALGLLPEYPLTILQLSRNFGKEYALTAGIDHARGDGVILIDADFQHPLAMIPEFVDLWRKGYDMVYGIRARAQEGPVKKYLTRAFYRLLDISSHVSMPQDAGDFRLLDRRVIKALQQLPERSRYMKGLYAWVGFRSMGVPFREDLRLHGTTSFNWLRLFKLALTGITAFSDLPLRLWSILGAVVALISFSYGIFVIIEAFVENERVPGWATLVTGMMFFGGIQLLSVGVLGEYIARIFNEVKGRPNYLISREYHSPVLPASKHDDD